MSSSLRPHVPALVVGVAAVGSLAAAVWALLSLRRAQREVEKLADMRLQERQGRIRAEKVGRNWTRKGSI